MKIDPIQLLLSIGISALAAYGIGNFATSENSVLIGIGCFIVFLATLSVFFGIKFSRNTKTGNVKMVAGIFFIIFLIANIIYMRTNFSVQTYVIIMGILLLVYFSSAYGIGKAKQ